MGQPLIEESINECRICYDSVIDPQRYCNCLGSQGNIHPMCLIKSINENNTTYINRNDMIKKCELCNYDIKLRKERSYYGIVIHSLFYLLFMMLFIIFMYLDSIHHFTNNIYLGFGMCFVFLGIIFIFCYIVRFLIYKLKIHEYKITIFNYDTSNNS